MKCSKCGKECESIMFGNHGDGRIISKCCGAEAVDESCLGEIKDSKFGEPHQFPTSMNQIHGNPRTGNDWKDLDINNIPSDFFVNENYEYGYQFTCDKTWSTQTNLTPLGFIEFMQNNTNTIFRYRLKPLESEKPKRIMKVTQRIYDMFYHELIIGMAYIGYKSHMDGEDMIIDNCKVELL